MNKEEVALPADALIFIMGDNYRNLPLFLESSFCIQCVPHTTTIIDYEVYANHLNDIILKGKCKKCQGVVNRYLETGELPEASSVIKRLKSLSQKKTTK